MPGNGLLARIITVSSNYLIAGWEFYSPIVHICHDVFTHSSVCPINLYQTSKILKALNYPQNAVTKALCLSSD